MANRTKKTALTGGYAVGEAFRQINPDVMAVYPITPQTPIIEYFAKEQANGRVDTEIITAESEHSAMSACIGASASGVRVATASSSQGILYMMEVLPVAPAMRLPIVMAISNRAISAPINIHGDHSDAMAMKDFGWIQLFSENAQESYDNSIISQRVAENAMLPITINLDGFITSHSVENLELLDDQDVEKFIGKYDPKNKLFDFEKPKTFGPVALQNSYFEFRKQIHEAMDRVPDIYRKASADYKKISNRNYSSIEKYKTTDAEKIIIAMGSTCGTIRETIDDLRKKGEKIGMIKIRLFRPFPYNEVKKAINDKVEVIVMDRNLSFGTEQVLAKEIKIATGKKVQSVVYGLGGREIYQKNIIEIISKQKKISDNYLYLN